MLVLPLSGTSSSQAIGFLSQFDAFLLIFEGMILFFYLHGMHEVTAARASVRRLVKGDLAAAFWGGVVIVGLLIPFMFEVLWKEGMVAIWVASLCGLLGGIYGRYVVITGVVKAPLNAE